MYEQDPDTLTLCNAAAVSKLKVVIIVLLSEIEVQNLELQTMPSLVMEANKLRHRAAWLGTEKANNKVRVEKLDELQKESLAIEGKVSDQLSVVTNAQE